MIVSGGENVYPRAVENALGEHPDLLDSALLGVPDADYGHRLAAFVVIRPGAEVDENALRDYLRAGCPDSSNRATFTSSPTFHAIQQAR